MILKRQEKDGKVKAIYSSSTVCASIFDTNTKDLIVIFNNGGQYKYPSVVLTDYTRFETSESNGSTFNTYIKKKYTNFEKLEKLSEDQIKRILTEVAELSKAEETAIVGGTSKALIGAALSLSTEFVKTGAISAAALSQLKAKLEAYEKTITPKVEEAVTVS